MTSTPVANISSNMQSASPTRAGARKTEASGNPFQQMLSEELAGKGTSANTQAERTEANAAASEKPAAPAASPAKENQTDSGKSGNNETENATLSPELAAMIAGLIQRQEEAAPTGEAESGDAFALLGKSLDHQAGALRQAEVEMNIDADADFSASRLSGSNQSATQADNELDLQAALGRQGAADMVADEAPQTEFSTTLQQLTQAAQTGTARNTQALPTHHIAPQVGNPGWDQAIAQRVVWMASGAEQSASLTLNPPELGPLQVVLNISNSQANATFVAAHVEVRQALEAAMPKLREMLGDVGIQLDQASVNQGNPEQQSEFARSEGQGGGSSSSGLDSSPALAEAPVTARPAVTSGNGLVDTFA